MPVQKRTNTAKLYTHTIGRRKTATARVRLFQKKGESQVNEQLVAKYFPLLLDQQLLLRPLTLTKTDDKFYFTAKVAGSGIKAQRDAISHGLARALSTIDSDVYRPILKKEGLLTRDPRMKESRKVGTGGKARRKKQSPKR